MTSQNPLQVPEIHTIPSPNGKSSPRGGRHPSPETSCFSLRAPEHHRSSPPGEFPGSPASIHRTDTGNSSRLTPPAPELQSGQDSSYFSTPQRSQTRQTRTNSPSERLSNPTCLSPDVSSNGSFHSSEFGHSPCSHSSGASDFLTPPREQPDTDNPPYKARRESSGSLTMVRKLRRANTMPYDKEQKRRKRHGKHHKCDHKCGQKKIKLYEHQNRSYWWLPSSCQVAPTAPRGQKQLCEDHAGHYTPKKTRYGSIDTYGKLPPEFRSKPAPAVVTRRWSSVEIGAHQVILESTFPLKPAAPQVTSGSPIVNNFVPKMLNKPYRSSTFTRGAIDHNHDILHTVRKKLALHKIPNEKLVTPESITLRRASGGSPEAQQSNDTSKATPRARPINVGQKRHSVPYFITTEEIDSIPELIEANLRRNYDAYGRYDRHACSSRPSQRTTPSSSITGTALVTSKSYSTQPSVVVTEVQPINSRPRSPLNYLQVAPECKTKTDAISRSDSQRSVHEVIWESGASPLSLGGFTDEDDSRRSGPCSAEPSTPNPINLQMPGALRVDKGDAFDPQNANASINEWSWRCPQNEIAVVLTSSDSDSNDVLLEGSSDPRRTDFEDEIPPPKAAPRARDRPLLRSAVSQTKLQDVVSFPPLAPRKKTNDWYSPLPPMEAQMPPPLATSRSLYDIGIDVSFGPSSSKTVTPRSSQTSWVRSTEVSPTRSIEFDPNYEIRCKSPESCLEDPIHRKCVIKAHPNASARTGEFSTIGSSLGASSHEKRKSSTPIVQRPRSPRICESAAERVLIQSARRSPPSQIHRTETSQPTNSATMKPTSCVDIGGRNSSPALRALLEFSPPRSERTKESSPEASHPDERGINSPPRLPRVRTVDNAHKGEHEVLPTKWRAPSPCPTPRSRGPSEDTSEYEDSRDSLSGSPDPSTTTPQVRRAWIDRLSLLRSRSPPLPAVDRVGIYGRMSGGQGMWKGDPCGERSGSKPHVCDDCPKPSEPHICDDCAKDPRAPSIDWIG
jgi:hypothetical protein